MRSWARFHKNTLSSLYGGKTLPSVSPYPTFAPKIKRIIRRISLISAVIFSLCFIVGFIAGVTAPPGKRMGHAGAIISGGKGTAQEKLAVMEECGITVTRNPAEIGKTLKSVLK